MKYHQLPRHELELLLAHVLGKDRLWVLTHHQQQLSDQQQKDLHRFIDELMSDTPLAYIVGYKRFYDVDFIVNKHVLIPRQETEELIQHLTHRYNSEFSFQNSAFKTSDSVNDIVFVDVGTGSGCIGLTLARLMPQYQFCLTDISKQALAIAQKNYQKQLSPTNVKFFQGDLLESVLNIGFYPQVVIANLPYISAKRYQELPSNVVKYEPRLALDGGADGLQPYRKLLTQISTHYQYETLPELWWEISPEQADLIAGLFIDFPKQPSITIIADLNQRDRFVHITF